MLCYPDDCDCGEVWSEYTLGGRGGEFHTESNNRAVCIICHNLHNVS